MFRSGAPWANRSRPKGLRDHVKKLLSYELVGVFWFKGDCRNDPKCGAVGGTELSNTTMETFEQYFGEIPGRDKGCTICHGVDQFNPMPYKIPVAQGIADRSFIFHRIDLDWKAKTEKEDDAGSGGSP